MKQSVIFFKLGAWFLLGVGFGHALLIDILPRYGIFIFQVEGYEALVSQLRNVLVVFQIGETTFYDAWQGFSIWMGVSLIFLGLTNLIVIRDLKFFPLTYKRLCLVNFAMAGTLCFLLIQCFFIGPIIGSLTAAVSFLIAFSLAKKALG